MTLSDSITKVENGIRNSSAAHAAEAFLKEIRPVAPASRTSHSSDSESYAAWAWHLAKDVVLAHLPPMMLVDGAEALAGSVAGSVSATKPPPARADKSGDYKETMSFDGQDRTFTVHIPPNRKPGQKVPMMVMLHGITENGDEFARKTEMNKKADEAGFIAVYPDGSKMMSTQDHRAWNVPNWGIFHPARKADDVGFVKAVISQLKDQAKIDDKRVYLAGFSNGGMLAQQVALAMPGQIAGLALVNADLSGKDSLPTKGLSVIDIHGKDDVLNFSSVLDATGIVNIRSPQYTNDFWRAADNITGKSVSNQTGGLTIVDGRNEHTGAEVRQLLIDGGSHTWPGPTATRPEDRRIAANDAIWNFLSSKRAAV